MESLCIGSVVTYGGEQNEGLISHLFSEVAELPESHSNEGNFSNF